ncbi:synergin gamma-like isoform X2 [Amblyomma americanum]
MASKQGSKQPLSALEKKMMECSNLFEQSRGSSFAKPRLSASGAAKHTYASGFNMPRPPQQAAHAPQATPPGRLPVWCQRGDVPSLYRDLERQVTGPAGINGALVCSLLLSSGLSRPALGRIWDLCSRTVPGSFTQPELYASLALVALAQAGHPPELELLSRLPQPPVPMFAQPINNVSTAPAASLPQAWPNQMSPSPSPPALQQPSATCCQTFQASTNLFPSSPSSRPLQAAPPTSSVSAVTVVSSAAKPMQVVCASPVPSATLVSSAPATFVSSVPAAPFVSSIPAMTFASPVPAATAAPPTGSLPAAHAVPKLGAAVPSIPSVLPVTSSRPSVTFMSVPTPAVPRGLPAPLSCGLVGASGECGGALGNGGVFASSVPSLMNHGCPMPTTFSSGSGDFDDEFGDFKSAPEQSHLQQPLATDSVSTQVKPLPLGNLSKVTTSQPPLIEPTFAHDPRKANSLPDSPKLGPSKIAAVNAHNFQLSQQRNNICESPKMPKTFNFGLKIDLDSLMSLKPPVSQAAPVTNNVPVPEPPTAVDDDFADFQAAFPEASKPSVPTEDRYSVFKELCDDGLSLWSVTDAPTSDSKDANLSADVVDTGGHTVETWHNPLPELDVKADEEDFGDFCHVQVVPPPAPATPDKRANMFGGLLYNPGPFSSQSNDTISLGDGLSVNSLEFGAREGSLSSRHGSVLSLDFRLGNSDDDESASARTGCSDDARVAATADSQEEASEAATSSDTTSDTQPEGAASVSEQPVLLLDKYSVIRGINQDAPVGEAACIDSWTRCLESVRELIMEAESVFNREASSQICREALDTEEGTSYIHNLAEVYKVCQRIALSSRLTGLQSENLDKLCSEVQATWEQLTSYLENSCLFTMKIPPAEDAKWLPGADESAKSCGVCLLHVDNPEIASSKLSYSGREYHSPCANLWVNCVNSLLPAVTPVQLL